MVTNKWCQVFKKMLAEIYGLLLKLAFSFFFPPGEISIIFPMLTQLRLVLWILMQEMENFALRFHQNYGSTLMVKYQEHVEYTVKSCWIQ